MDILGIGPLELLMIFLIALIVLGPNDMVKAGRTLGRTMRKIVTSPIWRSVQDTSRQIRNLPNQMMREAGLEEMKELEELKKVNRELNQTLGRDLQKQNAPAAQTTTGLEDWIPPSGEKAGGESGPLVNTPPHTPEQTIAPPEWVGATEPAPGADEPAPSAADQPPASEPAMPQAGQQEMSSTQPDE
ncbi:MAG TPA: twin-arginine translocase TatA/TatE family subunit, partial [Anaerolineales bacterium]|nr:twin-arginine translocase TatA/TatE family subunit [Anaerolineales bacterium]